MRTEWEIIRRLEFKLGQIQCGTRRAQPNATWNSQNWSERGMNQIRNISPSDVVVSVDNNVNSEEYVFVMHKRTSIIYYYIGVGTAY